MKQMENEMNVNVPLEVIKASEIEPKEVKWLWYHCQPGNQGEHGFFRGKSLHLRAVPQL